MPTYADQLIEPLAQATGCKECGATIGMAALGARPSGLRLETIQSSDHFDGSRFRNLIPTSQVPTTSGLSQMARDYMARDVQKVPAKPHPIILPEPGSLAAGAGEALRVTWMGHSTNLLEIDGTLVLIDPVFGPRAALCPLLAPNGFTSPRSLSTSFHPSTLS